MTLLKRDTILLHTVFFWTHCITFSDFFLQRWQNLVPNPWQARQVLDSHANVETGFTRLGRLVDVASYCDISRSLVTRTESMRKADLKG